MSIMFPDSPEWVEFAQYALLIAKDYPEYKKDITNAYVLHKDGHSMAIHFPDASLPLDAIHKLKEKFIELYPSEKLM